MRSAPERLMLLCAFLGMLLALYALSLHYADSGSAWCNVGASFNCDKVNKSPWSELFGVPVSGLGMLAYGAVFFLILKHRTFRTMLAFTERDYWGYLTLLVTSMFLFQLYLTYIEAFVIRAYCIVCLVSQALVIVLLLAVLRAWRLKPVRDA